MSILKSPPDRLVTRSRRDMSGERGFLAAEYIYGHFSSPGAAIETLAVLSLICRNRGKKSDVGIIGSRVSQDFIRHGLVLSGVRNDPRRWLTDRGHVAISMVEAEMIDGDIDTHLTEPFHNHNILPALHANQAQDIDLLANGNFYSV